MTGTFGYAPAPPGSTSPMPPGVKSTYTQLNENIQCVENAKSKNYNKFVNHTGKPGFPKNPVAQTESGRKGKLFKWGVVIDQNPDGIVKGGGSCVYIHIAKKPGDGSAGCTVSSSETDIEVLTGWLQPDKGAIMVQLPYKEYLNRRDEWLLP